MKLNNTNSIRERKREARNKKEKEREREKAIRENEEREGETCQVRKGQRQWTQIKTKERWFIDSVIRNHREIKIRIYQTQREKKDH